MSLIPLDVVTKGTEASLRSPDEGWELPLSAHNARKANASSNGKVVLGARHSTLKLHKQAAPGAVPGKVYTVEPTGDVTFAQVFISGAVVNISLDPSVAISPDEPVWIEFDQERLHLFDGATTMALKAALSIIDENHDYHPYPTWVGTRNQLIVKVETDEGIYGWGGKRPFRPRKSCGGCHRALSRIPDRPRSHGHRRACGRKCIAASISRAGAC
jgi:hypothetical protein